MKAIFSSSIAQFETMRLTIERRQRELQRAEIEVSTGRHADVGTALGSELSGVIDMRALSGELDAILQSNGVVRTRLETSQSALGSIGELAEGFFAALTAARQGGGDRTILVADAKARLGALVELMSASSGGVYVFSGTRIDTPPLVDYLAEPMSGARADVQAAFQGALPPSLDAGDITAADMKTYLDTTFAGLFDDAGWAARFSSAGDAVLVDRIAPSETAATSLSANEPVFRKLVMALVATMDSDIGNLNAEAYETFMAHVGELVGGVSAGIARAQSRLGIVEERLAKASERITIERSALERGIGEAEGVDAYEAATRLTSMMNALEASYSVTARLQGLSLLNYL